MSIFARDALGHWSLGHPPDTKLNVTFNADVGVFTFVGKNAVFTISFADGVGTFTYTLQNATSNISMASGVGSFLLSGFGLLSTIIDRLNAGGFSVTGFGSTSTFDKAFTFKRFFTEDHNCKVYTVRVEKIKHP